MKKSRKLLFTLTSTLFLLFASLASCGNGEKSDVVSVHFWHTFGQDIQASITKKINKFEELVKENEGVDVKIELEYQGGYDDIESKILKGFAIGNTPSLAVCYPDHVANYISQEDKPGEYVVNLERFMGDDTIGFSSESEKYLNPTLLSEKDIVPSFLEEGRSFVNEGTYSLPFMKSTEVMYYDRDNVFNVLRDMGLATSSYADYLNNMTWDNFVDVLRFVRKDMDEGKGSYGTSLEVPLIYDNDSNLFISNSYQKNIDYLSMKNGIGSCDFNNNESKAMVRDLKGLYDEGLLLTKGTNNNEYGSNLFIESGCLFSIGSSGGAGYNDPGTASFEAGVCRVPTFNEDNRAYVTQGPCLTILNSNGVSSEANEERVKYAWKFLKYITNTQNNVDITLDSEGYIPIRSSSYETDDYKAYLSDDEWFLSQCADVVINDVAGKYINYPVFKGTSTARDSVGGIITQVFLNKMSIDDAFDQAYNNTVISMK